MVVLVLHAWKTSKKHEDPTGHLRHCGFFLFLLSLGNFCYFASTPPLLCGFVVVLVLHALKKLKKRGVKSALLSLCAFVLF